jgi:hypothetical protein
MPPRPAEASKVQPKKETVRINLPPKPTSAPTIKLPTLAPGAHAPTSATAAPVAVTSTAPASRSPAPPPPPASGASATRVAAAQAPARPVAAPRPMVPVVVGLSGVDKGLAVAAAVVSLAALVCVLYLAFFLRDTIAS